MNSNDQRPEVTAFSGEISALMNETWDQLLKDISDVKVNILGVTFALDHQKVDDIITSYIPNYNGAFDIVAAVSSATYGDDGVLSYSTGDETTLRAGVSYYYKGQSFVPRVLAPSDPTEPDMIYDHTPDILETILLAITCDKAQPLLKIIEVEDAEEIVEEEEE